MRISKTAGAANPRPAADPAGEAVATSVDAVPAPVTPATVPAPPIPDPIVATDANGAERPLSGGSFVRIAGKLVRQED